MEKQPGDWRGRKRVCLKGLKVNPAVISKTEDLLLELLCKEDQGERVDETLWKLNCLMYINKLRQVREII